MNVLVKMLHITIDISLFQINIFFETLDVEEVKETPQYPTIFEFLNTLGGALSLFLGASLISIFEVLEVLIRMIAILFY